MFNFFISFDFQNFTSFIFYTFHSLPMLLDCILSRIMLSISVSHFSIVQCLVLYTEEKLSFSQNYSTRKTQCRIFLKNTILCVLHDGRYDGDYRLYSREKTAASCIRTRYPQDAASLTDTRHGISSSSSNHNTNIVNIAAIIVMSDSRRTTPSSGFNQAR